ncbi:MAG: FtsX-like permease family protein [Actinomycetota bacterium]|nr:FtsX-like permease family protein [Actinomycetota bacterium]MDA2974339.1 FtsX-like permease family protein [Actinomycetota bacterium]MDA3009620.1 FtsX-like permease family protein [Actinomycetota bacterium]
MISRITYVLRETAASFQRNLTLTVAAVITAAVSLLIFGLTLIIQHGFDNLLAQWEGGVEMIVHVNAGAGDAQRAVIEEALVQQEGITIDSWRYCDVTCSLADADRLLAGDPTTRELLTAENITTQYKVVPMDATQVDILRGLRDRYLGLPNVNTVQLAEEQLDLISELQGFVSTYTTGLWIALMAAASLLIWNTIRTAMFARRREIEVMKLVGATDWFIRLPFMLEGLLHGLIGGVLASGALWFINDRWTAGVQGFPDNSGMTALVVVDGYQWQVALIILVFGSIVGTVGSGTAASRFLDV